MSIIPTPPPTPQGMPGGSLGRAIYDWVMRDAKAYVLALYNSTFAPLTRNFMVYDGEEPEDGLIVAPFWPVEIDSEIYRIVIGVPEGQEPTSDMVVDLDIDGDLQGLAATLPAGQMTAFVNVGPLFVRKESAVRVHLVSRGGGTNPTFCVLTRVRSGLQQQAGATR